MNDRADLSLSNTGRLSGEQTRAQNRDIRGEILFSGTLDRLQNLIAVLNEQRQVVYANRTFVEFAGRGASDEMCGIRPGEIFNCIHASENEKGCGESQSCRLCGAMQAILETQATGLPATRECRITSSLDGKTLSFEFYVRSIPFDLSGVRYVLLSFRDIRNEKRKAALERIFFHDILNTASSIRVYLDLLKAGVSGENNLRIVERLEMICNALVEEIQSQKILVSAENKTLTVQKSLISAQEFVGQLIGQFEDQEISRGKTISRAPFSESFALMSDDSLLRRVLANGLKNALEATPEGGTVTVGFGTLEGGKARFWVRNPTYVPPEVQRQIFQRYFSTKGEDRGLGTYGMKLLTEEYLGGKVGMESSPEHGTTFTVTLPLRP
jgi:signal transduction histidine kinase